MAPSSRAVKATPPWLELPREITAAILHKLGPLEILATAQNVCTTWRSMCQDPSMWRCIDMRAARNIWDEIDRDKVCRQAVDLSQGQLIDIYLNHSTSDLLLYVCESSSQLRCLRLAYCYGITADLTEAMDLPLLEELYLHYTSINVEAIKIIGRSCPLLKSFTLKTHWSMCRHEYNVSDLDALAIAETMPGLCRLQLVGNRMTNKGLLAILDGCPHLRSLDLRRCYDIHLGGEIGKLCLQRIKDLRLPDDPVDMVSDYDDYPEFSDGSVSSYEYEEELYVD